MVYKPSLSSRYLSQEDVLDQSNPFVQLVSGVVWLLRNGEVYINQSLTAECDKTQETGVYCAFSYTEQKTNSFLSDRSVQSGGVCKFSGKFNIEADLKGKQKPI